MKKNGSNGATTCCKTEGNCCLYFSWLVLVVGLLYLLQDYGMLLSWWRISPFTALFVLVGLKMVCKAMKC